MVVRIAQASLAAQFDQLFAVLAGAALDRSARALAATAAQHVLGERMRLLAEIHERHRDPRYCAAPEVFFGAAGEARSWETRRVRPIGETGDVFDVRWQSGYAPLADEPEVRAAYLRSAANRYGHARMWLHRDRPRPTALLLHGYLGGRHALEERAWPMRWMFEQLGLDLVLGVLPFHGPRNDTGWPLFPTIDPRFNVEGFRHAIWDLISLRRWLEAERGAPAVGAMGMSLGGYTSALLATAEPSLAFVVPMIPLASIADFVRDGGRLLGTPDERLAQHAALEEAYRPVSPLARPARIDAARVRILAAAADRITPTSHASRLGDHFGAPVTTFHGGHLLQFGRGEGFRAVARMLRDHGWLAPRVK